MTTSDRPSILIVDDDEVYRNRLARAFTDRGYDVRTGSDYDTALAVATEESPELAVVDLKMPGKSGLELVKALHRSILDETVVLTGYGSIATRSTPLASAHHYPRARRRENHRAFARGEAPRRYPPYRRGDYRRRRGASRVGEHQPRSRTGGNISKRRRLGIHRAACSASCRSIRPRSKLSRMSLPRTQYA